ncbi:MAG TPA: SDR family oxidoreductase [Phenylobacterium sp.]|uniref:SDR family NAD(P)-dependent oxidoreductase n=1 Tax=Phenylobacterium sp. TaxID=1871053 RepID=UPI002B48E587|nr:SDR family oxidoreductase [Phenylobacterium sp.]HKR88240.1 SDR family oxidoreductase [Phenylobacterium sp.]HKT54989.1 SDR family oxidoreductase [Caulobacteraceae bacterium]
MASLSGLGAIVLGAAGKDNLGQAIARRFARDGARVLVAGRDPDELKALAEEIGGIFAVVDATKAEDLARLTDRALEAFGRLDIGVNATGRNLVRPILETSPAELRDIAEIQFVAPFMFLQTLARAMSNGGALIHLSSVTARIMMRHHAAYMGTKAAMEHVVRAFAFELGPRGIRVNAVAPALTRSPMTEDIMADPAFAAFRAATFPMRRLGTPEDLAAAVAWLCDPECFVTGEALQVNGGASLLALPEWPGPTK